MLIASTKARSANLSRLISTPGISIRVAALLIPGLLLLSCGGSDSGDQANLPPVANAAVLGTGKGSGEATSEYTVRSGTEVLLSGKDSEGADGPILEYEWNVVSVVGGGLSVEQIESALYERTIHTKRFRVPQVGSTASVKFELTVEDADGDLASDGVTVRIDPAADPNHFLIQDNVHTDSDSTVANTYELILALDMASGASISAPYEVVVDTWAEWTSPDFPRDPEQGFSEYCTEPRLPGGGKTCAMPLPRHKVAISGMWPAGIPAEGSNPYAWYNPRFRVELPFLNIDDINQAFETKFRENRVELWEVDNVKLVQRFHIVESGNSARLFIGHDGQVGLKAADALLTDLQLLNLSSVDGSEYADVPVEDIRQLVGREGAASASAYYTLVDPEDDFTTLNDWLCIRGFAVASEEEKYEDCLPADDVAEAVYVNNYDLGFGRRMFMRRDQCDNIFSYVVNYPSLEAAIKQQDDFAIVVMEYAPLDNDTSPCSDDQKVVKFFAYVPDDRSGNAARVLSMNFDGRGEKYLPGVCTACHGGSPGASAELNSTFMPFDIDSFLFAGPPGGPQSDPDLNLENLPASIDPFLYTLDAQLEQFRQLNGGALFTYLHKKASVDRRLANRFSAPVELVNVWYDSDVETLDSWPDAGLDGLEGFSFDGSLRLPGWESAKDAMGADAMDAKVLHDEVFARHCRACHIQLETLSIQFDKAKDFRGMYVSSLPRTVFQSGTMPMARLTMDRVWNDFYEPETSAAAVLYDDYCAQNDYKYQAICMSGVPPRPGTPFASLKIVNKKAKYLAGESIRFDGTASVFVDDMAWRWNISPKGGSMAEDCSEVSFNLADTLMPSVVADKSPCDYEVKLELLLDGLVVSEAVAEFVVDRVPVPACINASFENFEPSDTGLLVDVLGKIQDRGDDGLEIVDLPNDPDLIDNKDGTVTVLDPPLDGSARQFTYNLVDVNGSKSKMQGLIFVRFSTEEYSLSPPCGLNIPGVKTTEKEFELHWLVAADQVEAARYNIFKNEVKVNAEPLAETSYPVSYMDSEGLFTLKVQAVTASVQFDSSQFEVTRSYTLDIDPIFKRDVAPPKLNCVTCHMGGAGDFMLSRTDFHDNWAALRQDLTRSVGAERPRLSFDWPELSNLVVCGTKGCEEMSRGNDMSQQDAETIIKWLEEGGLRN